jgi:hypothetical protein
MDGEVILTQFGRRVADRIRESTPFGGETLTGTAAEPEMAEPAGSSPANGAGLGGNRECFRLGLGSS